MIDDQLKIYLYLNNKLKNIFIAEDVIVKRVTRIELATSAWEAGILPLNYTRNAGTIISQHLTLVNNLFKQFF